MKSLKLPLWLRFVLLVGVVGIVSGAGLLAYRYWTRPVTLSVAADPDSTPSTPDVVPTTRCPPRRAPAGEVSDSVERARFLP